MVKQFRYAADNLGYLVYGDKTAMAIDGGAADEILAYVQSRNLELTYVTNTHSHMDHTTGNQALLSRSKAVFLDFNALLKKGGIDIDGKQIHVFHTPGHTSDSVCFYFDNTLIAGDTLFNGKISRCFTGDYKNFLKAIKTILKLPNETIIYAGHDYVEEYVEFVKNLEPDNVHLDPYLKRYDPNHVYATLADERKVDPFLRFNDEKIISLLEKKGLAAKTELDRWESLMSLM
ncbi:MAG: hydroxyacylglutathione hydrolase [Desulfobacteraceae bacterium]|nr:MBL fold metallo-hydrolase [Desulfobacteraceae bacterium]MBC2754888.1 hydroxyacylglutathione hydrolase [Desulfobacteraceae bacterium]